MDYLSSKLKKTLLARRKLLKLALIGSTGVISAFLGQKLALSRADLLTSRFRKKEFDTFPEPPRGTILRRSEFEVITVNERGREIRSDRHESEYFKEELSRNVSLAMVAIPGGTFTMGASELESDIDRERPQHEVEVPPFFMSKLPITQAQWREVANNYPRSRRDLDPTPSTFSGNNLPVEGVSWEDAIEFCRRISRKTRHKYRLPSEAEWEYACRAGTETPFYFGETITSDLANYMGDRVYAEEESGEFRNRTTKVGIFPPNAFGLYDMHGQVWEWCEDMWYPNYYRSPKNGAARTPETDRRLDDTRSVLRGGAWESSPLRCRSAYRTRDERDSRSKIYGFRVVCEAEEG